MACQHESLNVPVNHAVPPMTGVTYQGDYPIRTPPTGRDGQIGHQNPPLLLVLFKDEGVVPGGKKPRSATRPYHHQVDYGRFGCPIQKGTPSGDKILVLLEPFVVGDSVP